MSERDPLIQLLGTPSKDAGCEETLALLAEYVEGELEGRSVRELLPAVAAHLRNCPACAEDHEGLIALVREQRAGS
jgi:anti-sigma factor RsiW